MTPRLNLHRPVAPTVPHSLAISCLVAFPMPASALLAGLIMPASQNLHNCGRLPNLPGEIRCHASFAKLANAHDEDQRVNRLPNMSGKSGASR